MSLTDNQAADLRRISQQLAFANILTIVNTLNPGKTLDEGEFRKECEKAMDIIYWFKKAIKESLY